MPARHMNLGIGRRTAMPLALASMLAAAALALSIPVADAQDEIGSGTPEQPRDIAISMTDALRFDPAGIVVGAGEVVRFVLTNPSAATHDFLIGDLATQEEHGTEMAAGMTHMPGACPESEDHADEAMTDDGMMMEGEMASHMPEGDVSTGQMDETDGHLDDAADHAEGELCPGGIPGAVTIEPGETVSVLARFDEPGETLIGCHQPGHWEAGMMGIITIVDTESVGADPSPQP